MPTDAIARFLASHSPPPSDRMTIIERGGPDSKVSVFDKTVSGPRMEMVAAYHGGAGLVAGVARRGGHRSIAEHAGRLAPATCAILFPWGYAGAPAPPLGAGPLDHRLGLAVGLLRAWLSREQLVRYFFAPALRPAAERGFWAGAGFSLVGSHSDNPYFFLPGDELPNGY